MYITQEDLGMWKREPITQEVFKALLTARTAIEEALTNVDILLGNKETIGRLIGQKEGINLILEISAEEVSDDADTSDRT